jgi:hypothetical protein
MLGFLIFYWIFSAIVTAMIMKSDDCSWFWAIFGGVVIGMFFFPIAFGRAISNILDIEDYF